MADQVNEIVSDQKVASTNKKMEVTYFRPSFLFRVLANLIDILIVVIVFVSGFLGVREIIKANPDYKAKNQELIQIRLDSGVYAYDDDNILKDIISIESDLTKQTIIESKILVPIMIMLEKQNNRV